MDFKLLLVMTVVSMVLLVPDGASAWKRFRGRTGRWIKNPYFCRGVCKPFCNKHLSRLVCNFACQRLCGKRSLADNEAVPAIDPDFNTFDKDEDGFITKEEFRNHFHTDNENVAKVYDAGDTDNDGKLSREEYNETFRF